MVALTIGVWLIAFLMVVSLGLIMVGWSDIMNALAGQSRRVSLLERAQRAKQSRILLRESGDKPGSATTAMPIARREHTEKMKTPDKPHTPLADPEHPDRPFFG